MKPKFQLRVQKLQSVHAKSKPKATIGRKFRGAKYMQIEEAVKFCIDHNVPGYKALKTRLYPLVKDRETINRRLDRKIKNGKALPIIHLYIKQTTNL